MLKDHMSQILDLALTMLIFALLDFSLIFILVFFLIPSSPLPPLKWKCLLCATEIFVRFGPTSSKKAFLVALNGSLIKYALYLIY